MSLLNHIAYSVVLILIGVGGGAYLYRSFYGKVLDLLKNQVSKFS